MIRLNEPNIIEDAAVSAGLKEGDRLLDVGCGQGETLLFLKNSFGIEGYGIDRSDAMLGLSPSVGDGLDLRKGDACDLAFEPSFFDAVVMECSLSLIKDRAGAIDEVKRVLKPFGKLIVTDLCVRPSDVRQAAGSTPGWAIDPGEFAIMCGNLGFTCLYIKDKTGDLDEFAAEKIWEYGSIAAYLDSAIPPGLPQEEVCQVDLSSEKPGYFLLIMEKDG